MVRVRRDMLGACLLVASLAAAAARKPNFLYLLVDDLGYADVDICPDSVPYELCMQRPATKGRSQHMRTPRLKQMAAEGMIMTNWYAPRPICSPSRSAILTGRDPVHYGGVNHLIRIYPASSSRGGLPQSEKTVAEYLKDLGYTTGYVGKWHVGLTNGSDPTHYAPWNQGFDETSFFVAGSNGEPCEDGNMNPPGDDNVYHMCSFSSVMDRNGTVLEQPIRWENATTRALAHTVDFIEKHAADEKPWFFMHAFTAVHIPWIPSRFFVSDPVLHLWTDMVSEVDWATGMLLDKLRDLGIANDTVVVFSSDNGPYLEFASTYCPQNCKIQKPHSQVPPHFGCSICDADTVSLATPLLGGKGQVYEGGVRVPGIWWWPGHIPAGSISPAVTNEMDFLPTAVALAGGTLDSRPMDGKDISALLLEPPAVDAEPSGVFHYWCGAKHFAVRDGRHKVFWFAQKHVDANGQQTPATYCAQTGGCCDGSPSRLCMCNHPYVDEFETPKVIDLVQNVGEDFDKALDPNTPAVQDIVQNATKLRLAKLREVAEERCAALQVPCRSVLNKLGYPKEVDMNATLAELSAHNLSFFIVVMPDLMMVDNCLGTNAPPTKFVERVRSYIDEECAETPAASEPTSSGEMAPGGGILCPVLTEKCQLPEFRPYEECSISDPTMMSPSCANRRPCGVQKGYLGPFEYVNPGVAGGNETWCGAFLHPAGNSYLPKQFEDSICKWHQLFPNHTWCAPSACATPETEKACREIAQFGLNDIPTGQIWNEPYPDDQVQGRHEQVAFV